MIVNNCNFLKSFRYELFCLAREHKTSSCIISTFTPDAVNDPEKMSQELYDNICSRFEKLLKQDWDQPVFTTAESAFQFISDPKNSKKLWAKRATAINRLKQIPLF